MCAILLKMKSGMFCEIYYIKSIVQVFFFWSTWNPRLEIEFKKSAIFLCLCQLLFMLIIFISYNFVKTILSIMRWLQR